MDDPSPQVTAEEIRFGSCVLDLAGRRLYRDGEIVHITPKAFDLLRLLLDHAPKALTKAQLLDHLWPNTFVSDDALARLVSDVRMAIGDSSKDSKAIRTIHGFGYAFDAEITNAPASKPSGQTGFKLTWATHEYNLRLGENIIGRDPDVAVPINSSIVSRRHARIVVDERTARVADLNSKNGTFIGKERLSGERELKDGDILSVGDHEFTFRVVSRELPTVTRQQ